MESEDGLRYLEAVLRYVISTLDMSDEEIKNVVKASVSKEKGELIMTTMRWMNEGYHKGVQELADLLIKDQFANHYQILKPLIYKIKDTDKLKRIVVADRNLKNAYELQKLIEQ